MNSSVKNKNWIVSQRQANSWYNYLNSKRLKLELKKVHKGIRNKKYYLQVIYLENKKMFNYIICDSGFAHVFIF